MEREREKKYLGMCFKRYTSCVEFKVSRDVDLSVEPAAIIGRGERGQLSSDAWTVKGQKLGLISTAVLLFFISKPSDRRVRQWVYLRQ